MKAVVTLTKNFFNQHPTLAGKPTNFATLVTEGSKIHTCRSNYDYWKAKIKALKEADGTLCLREWTGRPYRSPQGAIMEIPAAVVGVEKLTLKKGKYRIEPYRHFVEYCRATVGQTPVDVAELARNDGFTNKDDYLGFFTPLFDASPDGRIEMAIIHFTTFRYGSEDHENENQRGKESNNSAL